MSVRIDVIRDVLDKQLLDAHRHRIGKVDGLVLELRDGAPPRVTALRVGSRAWMRRIGPRFERIATALIRRVWSGPGVWEIPWRAVLALGKNVQIDQDGASAPQLAWERWLCERLIARIPRSDR